MITRWRNRLRAVPHEVLHTAALASGAAAVMVLAFAAFGGVHTPAGQSLAAATALGDSQGVPPGSDNCYAPYDTVTVTVATPPTTV